MKKIVSVFLFYVVFLSVSLSANAKVPYKIINEENGIYVIEVINKKSKFDFKFLSAIKNKYMPKAVLTPVVVDELETNSSVFDRLHPKFVVNAGFFDPVNMKTVSYVVINGNPILNPIENENLMLNAVLEPYMDKILNRSEFRIYVDSKKNIVYDIVSHNDIVPEIYTLKHSIQAGPMLLPDLRLEEEFFILVKDGKIISESASSLHRYARTAIGIKQNEVFIFIVTNDSPMTLEELSELTKKYGMEKAMAFDGGGSTSFDSKELHIISEKDNQARKLKSFLMLK